MEWIELMEWNEERKKQRVEYAFGRVPKTGQFDFFFFFDSA